jgi:AcrR family transcriptional regulator
MRGARKTPRERILETAARLFNRDGVRATGIDAVIAKAKVAKATFYAHFPSKDRLVVEWIRATGTAFLAGLEAGIERRAKGPLERLPAFFDALGDWFRSGEFRGCPFLNTLAEMADLRHPASAACAEQKEGLRLLLRRLAADAGVPDPEETSRRLLLVVDGAIATAVREGKPDAARRAREVAMALI